MSDQITPRKLAERLRQLIIAELKRPTNTYEDVAQLVYEEALLLATDLRGDT